MGIETRHYKIQSFSDEVASGTLPDGRQVLVVSLTVDSVAALYFDQQGKLLGSEERRGTIVDSGSSVRLASNKEGLSWVPGAIKVHSFSAPEFGIDVRQRPDCFDEFLARPEQAEPDPAYRERTRQQIDEWQRQGRFVLQTWGKEYWIDEDGSIYAT